MINKIKSISQTVKHILIKHPDTRDNDKLLMMKVWCEQNRHLRSRTFTFYSFALDFISGVYADPESIRRSRQKIQEQQPHLRGTGYHQKKHLQQDMQMEIKDLYI